MRFIHELLAGIIEATLYFFAFFCYAIEELLYWLNYQYTLYTGF